MWQPRLCFYQRLSVSLVAVFFAVITLFVLASSQLQTSVKNEGEQRLHLNLAKHLVNDNPLLKKGVYDYEALSNLFNTLMVLGPNFEFYFIDSTGKILTHSAQKDDIVTNKINLEPVAKLLNNSEQLPIFGTDPKSKERTKIFSVAPVFTDNAMQGFLYVIIGGSQYDTIVDSLHRNQGVQQFAMIILSGTLFLLLALLVLFRVFTLPLKRLSDDMDSFRKSGFNLQASKVELLAWKSDSRNEIERLGVSFNDMLKHINSQWEQITQTDNQRKNLLADLSHDLRTPLANLQGFTETLAIKGDSLHPDDRKKFIDICLKNLNNLKRLIDQIFELAHLDSGHIKLKNEAFLPSELIHDIAAKFFIKAKQKEINLKVQTDVLDTYLNTDIEKLERVLTNLIDNAIRHTDSGGDVLIKLIQHLDKVKISVCDTGIGIAEDELPYIFDARYQASNNKRDATAHVGLGLAISRKLINLLNSKMNVASELGKGTTFSFELEAMSQGRHAL